MARDRSSSFIPRSSSGTALSHRADCLLDQAHRVIRMHGGGEQPVKRKGIALHVCSLFEIYVTGEGLDVDDGRVGWLKEVQDDERAGPPSVCTCTERHDLQRCLSLLSAVDEVP